MSKIALQGNVSGTGTISLVAPNSNTDRTLTLPDETGTVLTNTSGVAKTGDTMTGNLTVDGSVVVNGATTNSNANWGYYINPKSGGAVGDFTITDPTGNFGRLNIDGSGRVTMPYQPFFRAYFTSQINITIGNQVIAFNTTVRNVGNHFNTSTYRFTCPVAGRYFFNVGMRWDITASGYNRFTLRRNGSDVAYNLKILDPINTFASGLSYQNSQQTAIIDCSAGDYFEVIDYSASTGATYAPHESAFMGYLIG